MFSDDTNLFYSYKGINALFLKVNNELHEINQWFISNKLSLNIKKTKYSLFHKRNKKDDVPLLLPKLKISMKLGESTKFLGVPLDENLTWKPHIKYIENKIAKNIGFLFKAKPLLNKQPFYLCTIYISIGTLTKYIYDKL